MPKAFLNIDDFGRGINTVKNPRDLSIGEAVEIENFDLSNRGELRPRGLFKTATDGSAVTLQSNTVPKHTASINPGHGLFYFEADDPATARGVSITGNGSTGVIADGPDGSGKYVLIFYDSNKIFINEASTFWAANNLDGGNTNDKAIIRISGSVSNDGIYNVTGGASFGARAGDFQTSADFADGTCDTENGSDIVNHNTNANIASLAVGRVITGTGIPDDTTVVGIVSSARFRISNNATADGTNVTLTFKTHLNSVTMNGCVLTVKESQFVTEQVGNGVTVSIGLEGFVGDNFLALGNTDDNKIDIYSDSSDAFTPDAISQIYLDEDGDIDSNPKFNFYYADNILRTSDGNLQNRAKTRWYGKINNRQQFNYIEQDSGTGDLVSASNITKTISQSIESAFYEEENDLASPTSAPFTASGSVDGSTEFPTKGAGWGLSVAEGTAEGSWESKTYEFACSFIYDKNQESLLRIFNTDATGTTKATFTNTTGFKELIFNVFAEQELLADSGSNINETGGYGVGVSSFTVDGTSPNNNYNIGDVVLDQYNRKIGHVKTLTGTSINFREPTLVGIADDDNLYYNAAYANRITGGRIYIREAGTNEDWSMIADIDITKGVRASFAGEYLPWVQDDASSQEFRITSSTANSNRGTDYWRLSLTDSNLDTYSSINGFSQSTTQIAFGKAGSGFKTAIICNRRAFVANIKYDEGDSDVEVEEFQHFGDRIMFSEIGKYDTFPNSNSIDVTKGDGEDYVKLETYSDRLLAYKQRTLQILNVASPSPSNWFLEDTVQFAGIANPYSICKGEDGVVWANLNGLFLYNGGEVRNLVEGKISASDWATFCADKEMVLGYEPKEDQIIIVDKASVALHAYIYNLKTNSFSYGKYLAPNSSGSFTPTITNFVNTSKGQLISAYDVQSTDLASAGNNTIHFTEWDESPTTFGHYKLVTPDFNFNSPSTIKKIYKIYIHYRSTADVTVTAAMVYYQVNQNNTWTAFNAGSMARSESSGAGYDIAVFTPSATFECQSVAIKIEPTVTTGLYINDIQIEYRNVRKRVS